MPHKTFISCNCMTTALIQPWTTACICISATRVSRLLRKLPFDGHAIDIWAGVFLKPFDASWIVQKFGLTHSPLIGLLHFCSGDYPPIYDDWKTTPSPPLVDGTFDSVDLGVSYEAMDSLRKMFRLDPSNRLSLSLDQIKNHNWVRYELLSQR